MRLSRSRLAGWLLACALPHQDLEIVIGDLEEEYALRSRSRPGVSRWYWGQIIRSIPLLLWTPVQRGGWLPTLSVALGACALQALVELAANFAFVSLFSPGARLSAVLTVTVTLSSLAILSYLATRIRPGAATLLTALVAIAIVVQLIVKSGHGMAFGTRLAVLFVGPSIAFAGGVFSLKTSRS